MKRTADATCSRSMETFIWQWNMNLAQKWLSNQSAIIVGWNEYVIFSALKIMVAGYLLVVTEKVASYRYPPTGAPLFFVPRKDFATGHWTLACCLILLLHIILICCSTSYSHNREGFYISQILCIDLDFSGTVKHQSESQNSRSVVSENQRDCQSPKEFLQWQPTFAMSPIVKTRLPMAGNCTYPTPLFLLLLPSCIWQRIHVHTCPRVCETR